jgi:hypothetical protein
MLVRCGNRAAADAGDRRGLPVPGLFKEGGFYAAYTPVILKSATFSVPRMLRSAPLLRRGALLSRGRNEVLRGIMQQTPQAI